MSPEHSTFQFEMYSPKREKLLNETEGVDKIITCFFVSFLFVCLVCSRVFNAMLSFVLGGGADSEALAFETFAKIILIIKMSCLFSVYSATTNISPPKSNMEPVCSAVC